MEAGALLFTLNAMNGAQKDIVRFWFADQGNNLAMAWLTTVKSPPRLNHYNKLILSPEFYGK
jgi:hypothetical protein